jgi:hypothetical protein
MTTMRWSPRVMLSSSLPAVHRVAHIYWTGVPVIGSSEVLCQYRARPAMHRIFIIRSTHMHMHTARPVPLQHFHNTGLPEGADVFAVRSSYIRLSRGFLTEMLHFGAGPQPQTLFSLRQRDIAALELGYSNGHGSASNSASHIGCLSASTELAIA